MWRKVNLIYDWLIKTPISKYTAIVLFLALVGTCFYFIREVYLETKGEIIVDEPKVYTRERLVNDRFREEAWLNYQLTLPKREEFYPPEARMSSSRNQKLGITAETTKSDGGEAGQDQTHMQSDATSLEKTKPDIATSPVDTFTDMSDYRDKVRNELMRTELDDRHDIEGNTLYRLNFDTAIIPGGNTHVSAAILVTITPNDKANDSIENQEALFNDWAREIQNLVDTLIDLNTRSFIALKSHTTEEDPLLPDDQIRFEAFLRNKICEQVKSLTEKLYPKNPPSEETLSCKILLESISKSEQDIFYECDSHPNPFFCEVEKLIGMYSHSYELAINNSNAVDFFDELKIQHTSPIDIKKLKDKIKKACSPPIPNSPPYEEVLFKADGNDFEAKPDDYKKCVKNAHDKSCKKDADYKSWARFTCIQSPPTNRILIAIGLLERLNAVSELPPDKLKELVLVKMEKEHYPIVIEELIRPYVRKKKSNIKISQISIKMIINSSQTIGKKLMNHLLIILMRDLIVS